jgi:hypothetical protein
LRARHQAEAAEEQRLCAILRRDGQSCLKCLHYDKPFSLMGKSCCQLDSDFHGYAITTPTNVCSRFTAKLAE